MLSYKLHSILKAVLKALLGHKLVSYTGVNLTSMQSFSSIPERLRKMAGEYK